MTPRELGMALMRGNRDELKQGYSARSAYYAVKTIHKELQHGEGLKLLTFLGGFGRGMNRVENDLWSKEAKEGYKRGLQEDAFMTLPANVEGDVTTTGIE